MKPERQAEMLLKAARDSYPSAISAKSIKEAGLIPTAEQLVRSKLLLKAKFKGQPAYRLPDPAPAKSVISNRPQGSGAAYEREVTDAMKKLRESGGMDQRKKPPSR